MSKAKNRTQSARAHAEIKRRKNIYAKRMREFISAYPKRTLTAPVVVGSLLSGPTHVSFGDFLRLPETHALFGLDNDAATMLAELVDRREFLLLRASEYSKNKARWRRLLAGYVRRAYLGDVRGLLYWRRVSKIIWVAYENFLRLKLWAARTRDGEVARIARWKARAEKERARQKARREREKRGRRRSAHNKATNDDAR
jgi:hypothetical protein